MRRDVERRILHLHAFGRDAFARHVGDFAMRALLDGNLLASGCAQVHTRPRRRHIERDRVLFGQHGDRIGADLVGHVAIGGNAVRAHDHGVDLALLHDGAGHAVADHRGGDAIFVQLPGGQPRALQERTGLIGIDIQLFSLLHRRADDA